jgi:hypothetical protein
MVSPSAETSGVSSKEVLDSWFTMAGGPQGAVMLARWTSQMSQSVLGFEEK